MAESELPDFPVSPSRFEIAAKKAGFATLDCDSMASLWVVGDAIKKMGALKIGRSKLLLSDEQLGKTFSLCCDMVEHDGLEAEQKLAALGVMMKVATGRASAASDMIRSAAVDMSDSAKPAGGIPSFIPKQMASPVVTAEVIIDQRIANAKAKT